MKKIYLFALTAVAVLAGCNDSKEQFNSENDQDLIQFQSVVGKQGTGKALIKGAVYPEDVPFGSFAYALQQGQNWNDNFAQGTLFIDEAKIEKIGSDNLWTAKDIRYYWPKQGSLTFFSYSPYSATSAIVSCNQTNGIVAENFDATPSSGAQWNQDFMVSDIAKDQTKTIARNGVPTVFRHKLSTVLFKIGTLEKYDSIKSINGADTTYCAGSNVFKINAFQVNNIKAKGDYYQAMDTISAITGNDTIIEGWFNQYNDSVDYIMYNGDAKTLSWYKEYMDTLNTEYAELVDSSFIVLPQVLTDSLYFVLNYQHEVYAVDSVKPTTEFNYIDTIVLNTRDVKEWQMNKRYTYNILISLDEIKWAPSIVDWEEVPADTIIIDK
ncbi:MAG: fimbrillin family protein [Bacteroidaceae bacterium]|nr:fimbrillin family protein [Bacteroidaceae bacterium]